MKTKEEIKEILVRIAMTSFVIGGVLGYILLTVFHF